jgi:hypothetical protein
MHSTELNKHMRLTNISTRSLFKNTKRTWPNKPITWPSKRTYPHTIPHNRKELYTINHVKYNQNLQLCLSSPPTIKSRELHAARCTNTCIEHKIAIKMQHTLLDMEGRKLHSQLRCVQQWNYKTTQIVQVRHAYVNMFTETRLPNLKITQPSENIEHHVKQYIQPSWYKIKCTKTCIYTIASEDETSNVK